MNGNAPVKTILILAANPQGTSRRRLDEEVREIEAGLQRAQKRHQFILEQKWAVRPRDIQRALLDVNPQIVHFSGHGLGEEGLVFEDDIGQAKLVDGEALAGLFELFAEQVECVVLNGCYSQVQAKAIAQHIPSVIGMSQRIGDRAAIEFAVGFYDAIGAGRSVEFAHKLGCSAIRMAGIAENLTPVLIQKPELMGKTAPPSTEAVSQSVQPPITSNSENQVIEVFFSYAHKDEELRDELANHLKLLERQGVISAWHDRQITAGTNWEGQIDEHLESAKIILLLVSADFLASDYCYDVELKRAMERHEAKEARVIPIILREVDWQGASFGKLQALPKNAEPVTNWPNRDRAFADIARGIRRAVEELAGNEVLNTTVSVDKKATKENPFVPLAGKIEDIGLVFGRESEIEQIFEILNSGSGVALIGESGIGKSSLLNLIKIQAEAQLSSPRKPIYLDFGNVITDNDFYYGLCRKVGIDCDYERPLKGFLLKQELEKHRLLLLLDGLRRDMVWEGFTNPVRNQLRSLANTGLDAPLRLVVAADRPLTSLFADSGAVSPFENVCLPVELKPWDETTIRNFIYHRLAHTNVHFSESDIREAIKKSKGNLQKLMMFCYETYKKYC